MRLKLRIFCGQYIAVLCLINIACCLHAQSNEADIKARLIKKPLYLRGLWRDDKLNFDATGHLKQPSAPTPFTLSGFEFKSAHLKKDKLVIEGMRAGLELVDEKPKRVTLQVGNPLQPELEPIHIEVDVSATGDYGPALDAIFVDGLSELAPEVPSYWKKYFEKHLAGATDQDSSKSAATVASPGSSSDQPADTSPKNIGGGFEPPKLLKSAEPSFNVYARALVYSGKVVINLWIKPDGTVTHMSVQHALGLGLDEGALAAVQQYKFQPATQAGRPVLVEVNVEVNFQIF